MTLCHTGTRDLAAHVRTADIVVAAAGVPGIITGDMVKPGAAVLDVGVSRVDGKLAGDVAAGRVRRGRLGLAEPRRRRPDDPGDAAVQHRVSAAEQSLDAGPDALVARTDGPLKRPQTLGGVVYLGVLAAAVVGLGARRGRRLAHRAELDRRRPARWPPRPGWCSPSAAPGCCGCAASWSDVLMLTVAGVGLIVLAVVVPNQPPLIVSAYGPPNARACDGSDQAELLDRVALLDELGGGGVHRPREKSSISRPWTISQSPPLVVTG